MPYQRIALLCLAAWSWPLYGEGRTAEMTALQLATETLDSLRDATHKEKMKIVWPSQTAATDAPPAEADVYLIHGYIDYHCTRFTWRDGQLRAEWVRIVRTWFYIPDNLRPKSVGCWHTPTPKSPLTRPLCSSGTMPTTVKPWQCWIVWPET